MPLDNQTIIAVPITVEQSGQTRQFLVRLVEQLDIVLGFRGGDPYVSLSQLQQSQLSGLTTLEQTILTVITRLLTESSVITDQLLVGLLEATNEAIDALKSPDVISDNDTTSQTVGGSYSQTQVKAIADQTAANAVDFNNLLTALRGTGIIAT